ncbi:hypothetical protein BH11BAC2_BH11BAC2_02350 [soil metagenome]
MKSIKKLALMIMLLNSYTAPAQNNQTSSSFAYPKLTIEPGIGIKPYPISDILISNILQYNLKKRISFISYSSYTYNSAFLRNYNYIQTNYNYSLTQKIGIGTTVYSKHFTHTVSFMAGVKYDAFKETLNNPEFEKVSMSVSSYSPDFGLLYNAKVGKKKYFFSYRMYLPLYPYPFHTKDINAIDGNLANITLEFGFGIRLK